MSILNDLVGYMVVGLVGYLVSIIVMALVVTAINLKKIGNLKEKTGMTMTEHTISLIRIAIGFVLLIPINLTPYIVVPIALLLTKKEDDRLPKFFRYYDDYLYGLNGDGPWKRLVATNGRERTYWFRLRWLLRNRMTTFDHEVVGFNMNENTTAFKWAGDSKVGNYSGGPGFKVAVATVNGKKYPSYYFIHNWGGKQVDAKCVRIYIGWKLHKEITLAANGVDVLETRKAEPKLIQSVFMVHPYFSYDIRGRQK